MISTIVSRCEIYNFRYGTDNILSLLDITDKEYEKYYDQTMKLVYDLEHSKSYELMVNSKNLSKKKEMILLFIIKLLRKYIQLSLKILLYNYYNNLEFAKSGIRCN